MRGQNLSMAMATFGGRYARAVLMLFMTFYAFLISSVHKIRNFMHFSQNYYIHTDRRTDRQTDTPSYRDARTHLKSRRFIELSFLQGIQGFIHYDFSQIQPFEMM